MVTIIKIIILIFINIYYVHAQIYFNKRIDFDNRSENALSVLKETGGYIITGAGRYLSGVSSRIMFVKTDLNGNILIKKHYGKPGFSYSGGGSNSLIKTNDGGFAFGSGVFDSTAYRAKALLVKFNNNGDTLWTKTYKMGDWEFVKKCRQTNDNGFILAGFTQVHNGTFFEPPDFYIIKTDSLGNLIWKKKYGGTKREELRSVEITNDGCYLVSGFEDNLSGDINAVLFKVDTLGNKLWQKNLSTGLDEWLNGAFEQADGNYIVYGAREIPGYGNQDYIAKLDSNRNIIWEKTYGTIYSESLIDLKELSDGNFIASAIGRKINNPNVVYGQLIKFCSNGDTLWTRIYGGDSGAHYAYAVSAAADGGFIFVGSTLDSGIDQDMWLVKTDSLGCDSAGCLPSTVICPEDSIVGFDIPGRENFVPSLACYPNPFNETITIQFQLPENNDNAQIDIYEIITGRIIKSMKINSVQTQITFDNSIFTPGIYVVQLIDGGGIIKTAKIVYLK